MTLPPDSGLLDSAGKDALTLALVERLNDLTGRIDALEAENAALRAENATLRAENAALRKENAELRAKLKLPPKNPDNSSIPPSRGQKASEKEQRKAQGQAAPRSVSGAASEPDRASRRCGNALRELPCRCLRHRADTGSYLRPDRDS